MKRWQVFRYAGENLKTIIDENLHGYHNLVPKGYLRGVEVLGEGFGNALALSVWIYFRHHHKLPDIIAPKTFTEKQVLFKFFGLIPKLCPSDKLNSHLFLSKEHISLVNIPERIWASKSPQLPANGKVPAGDYYFKSNHGAGTNRPIKFPMEARLRKKLESNAQYWLTKVHNSRRALWWYETMQRHVYLEENLSNGIADCPDWKFLSAQEKWLYFKWIQIYLAIMCRLFTRGQGNLLIKNCISILVIGSKCRHF